MKVLHIITSLQTGGAEKLMVDLLPRFNKQGIQTDILLLNGQDTPFKQQLQKAGVRIWELGQGGSVYNPLHILRLISHIRKYDIVHTHNTAPQLFTAIAALFAPNVRLVTTEHSASNRRRNLSWYKCIDKWMYRQYHKIICISDKTEDNLRTYLNSNRAQITTIYNGVDVERFSNATPIPLPTKSNKVIAMVAGFRHEKDQPTVIRSLAMLPSEFRLILVGDGERRSEFESLAEALCVTDRCHFFGVRMDVPQILKSVDYIVISSHWEGLSLSSIEGMSVGKPFIASDVDGLHEMVVGAGILFEHENAQQLAEIIMRLDADKELYNKTAEACYAKAKQFDISVMVDGYIKVYESLINK